MSNPVTMTYYRVNGAFNNAANAAFRFVNLEKSHKKQSENYKERIQDVGGRISPTWVVMSVIGLIAAIGFGIYGAFNAQGAIAGIVDPMGNGVIKPQILMLIGASISIVGMIFGHMIFEGFSEGIDRDPYTGARTVNSKIWLSAVGIIGGIVYVGYQYSLVNSAGESAGIDETSGLAYMPYVVVGIAVLELLIGAFVLHKAFSYILLFVTSITLWFILRSMNGASRNTNDNYRQYMVFLDAYNRENPTQFTEREGNGNIRRAIAHFSGIELPDNNNSAEHSEQQANEQTVEPRANDNISEQTRTQQAANQNETTRVVEDFMNDTTDQDLTA